MSSPAEIRLIVFDWAGTTIDHGCQAPVRAFVQAFAAAGIEITALEARGPMGLHKRDHIRALLELPRIGEIWQRMHGRDWSESDVDSIYERFLPLQIDEASRCTGLVPGLLEAVAALRARGIAIGTSTGYPRAVAEPVLAAARRQGYAPDHNVCADEVPQARPAPWMIYRNMEALGVYPPASVVKVGDTVPDVAAGRNAGVWSVGVTQTSSDVGLTAEQFAALDEPQRAERVQQADRKLREAGAHAVIASAADLPELVAQFKEDLRAGQRP